MPLAVATKVIDQTAYENSQGADISRMEFGENGDGFLNKHYVEIVRYARKKLPDCFLGMHTNFQHLTRDKAEILLGEGLINRFSFNIDGANPAQYFAVKRLELNKVKDNVFDFLEVRQKTNARVPLYMYVLTLNNYISAVTKGLGVYPSKISDRGQLRVADDYLEIRAFWSRYLNPVLGDSINRLPPCGIPERNQFTPWKIDYSAYGCPQLERLEHEAFIAPDGTWYACCIDTRTDLALGNLTTQSLRDIYFGKSRRTLIDHLKNGRFLEVGPPCNTVNCCVELRCNETLTEQFEKVSYSLKRRTRRLMQRLGI